VLIGSSDQIKLNKKIFLSASLSYVTLVTYISYVTCVSYAILINSGYSTTWSNDEMILVVANVKGGPGKSCLAQNLAVYLQVVAGKRVLLVDADPQETTADWINERRENGTLPDIRFAKMTGRIRDDLLSSEEHYGVVVVDSS